LTERKLVSKCFSTLNPKRKNWEEEVNEENSYHTSQWTQTSGQGMFGAIFSKNGGVDGTYSMDKELINERPFDYRDNKEINSILVKTDIKSSCSVYDNDSYVFPSEGTVSSIENPFLESTSYSYIYSLFPFKISAGETAKLAAKKQNDKMLCVLIRNKCGLDSKNLYNLVKFNKDQSLFRDIFSAFL